jgi:PAS domain S-box-containing protein
MTAALRAAVAMSWRKGRYFAKICALFARSHIRDGQMADIAGWFQRQVERGLNAQRDPATRFRRLATLWVLGCAALALLTWICFRLGLNASVVAFAYLIVIVLLSLMDSFVSSAIFSLVAVGLLNYFFVEPIFTFEVEYTSDLMMLVGFVVTSFAISGLVRRVYRLGEEQRDHAGLLDLTHDAVIARDMDDVITFWNRGAEEFYGWKRQETVGRTTHNLLQTSFPAPLEEIMATLRRAGHWEGELRHTKRDGTQAWVSSRWSLHQDTNGRPIGTLETNNDITERKRAQVALQRSQAAYLAEAQRLSSTGSFGWYVASGDTFWSEESYRIFGYDPAVQPSLDLVMQRIHPEDVMLVRRVIERAANEGKDFDHEYRVIMQDGSVKYLHVVAHGMTGEAGELQFVGAVMDVTAARRAHDQLALAQAELAHVTRVSVLGQLTASISHEVNQPLTAIVTNGNAGLRWLEHRPPQLDEVRNAPERMISEGMRASEVVRRILALVQKSDLEMALLDINTIVNDGVSLVRREMTNHRIALRLDLAPCVMAVRGDRVQLQQVVINLMLNGAQAMTGVDDRPRELAVRSSQDEGGQVLVSVQDSGIGIYPAIASRLFDAFYTTKADGMGMGLSICRTIIEAHGGRIWASANEGPGANFQFVLPSAGD